MDLSAHCNGHRECSDGSDEEDCGMNYELLLVICSGFFLLAWQGKIMNELKHFRSLSRLRPHRHYITVCYLKLLQ